MTISIRTARPGDEALILRLVRDLAIFEREPDAVVATEAMIADTFFRPDPHVHCFIADEDGAPVALAIWFLTYSTWTGRPSLYLEDLFVAEAARGRGIARALFVRLAQEARTRGCARMDWAVLDWNVDAMAFYEKMGARRQSGWQPWRMQGEAIDRLAAEED